jgi:hypothetical protein
MLEKPDPWLLSEESKTVIRDGMDGRDPDDDAFEDSDGVGGELSLSDTAVDVVLAVVCMSCVLMGR